MYVCMCIHIYIYIYICVCTYIYIYIERERETYKYVMHLVLPQTAMPMDACPLSALVGRSLPTGRLLMTVTPLRDSEMLSSRTLSTSVT